MQNRNNQYDPYVQQRILNKNHYYIKLTYILIHVFITLFNQRDQGVGIHDLKLVQKLDHLHLISRELVRVVPRNLNWIIRSD